MPLIYPPYNGKASATVTGVWQTSLARRMGSLYNPGGGVIYFPQRFLMDVMPKLDRQAYLEQMRAEYERALIEVADAIDAAPKGRVIRDSEERARDALDRFRQLAYEKAVQLKVDAAEAAFSPSAQPDDGPATS